MMLSMDTATAKTSQRSQSASERQTVGHQEHRHWTAGVPSGNAQPEQKWAGSLMEWLNAQE